jgi:hypothetical protein
MESLRTSELLSLVIIEVRSPEAAAQTAVDLSSCRAAVGAHAFDVPGVAGATGQRCLNEGQRVQEVRFTRDRRLYKLKLEHLVDPDSTELIVDLATRQAEVSR